MSTFLIINTEQLPNDPDIDKDLIWTQLLSTRQSGYVRGIKCERVSDYVTSFDSYI